MTVLKAPVRQQSYLTEYDKLLAEQLRQMSGSIGPGDIAAESYGGKFPVGTMTAKILGSVLARAADKRAINREEQAKESYSRAMEIANAMERGNNLSTTGMSVSPEGNLEILPTNVEGGGVSTWTRPDILFTQEEIDKLNEIRDKEGNLRSIEGLKGYSSYREKPKIPYVGSEFEATSITPTGIPLAPQNVALTVGEKIPEDKSAISKFLSGTLPQKVLPTNAEQALSQALRGADVNELEFRDYMQNKRIQDRTLELAEEERLRNLQPQVERTVIYNKEGGMETAYKRTDPVNGRTSFSQEPNANVPFGPEYTIEPPKEIKQASTKAVLNTVTNEIEFATEKEIAESKNILVPLPKEESETAYDKKYKIFLNSEIERNSKLPDDKKLSITEIQRNAATLASTTRTQEFEPDLEQGAIEELTDIDLKQPLPELDIRLMSKADVMGAGKGAINFAYGLRGGKVPFQDQVQAGTNLDIINNKIKVPMVKEISDKGAIYTQKSIEALLPSTSNSDASNYAKIKSLIPHLNNKIIEAKEMIRNSGVIYPNDKKRASKAKLDAIDVMLKLQQIVPILENSLIQFDLNYSNTDNPFKNYTDEEFNSITEDDLKEEN
jgi:hypothetical protein